MAGLLGKMASMLGRGGGAAGMDRRPDEPLRVGYVLWDYPTLSQSFVHSEIKWLVGHGVDVVVYHKAKPDKEAVLDYKVDSFIIKGVGDLLALVRKHGRHLLHSHFAYPTATLFTWPVAEAAGIPFTLMPHAVDIFQYENMKKNRLGEMARSAWCKAVFALGPFHRDFFISQGVPPEKIIIKPNSLEPRWFEEGFEVADRPIRRAVFIGRFVEKKGVPDIIAVARRVTDLDVTFDIYGYGPLAARITEEAKTARNVNLKIGGMPNDECRRVMKGADLFFLPCVRAGDGDMDGLPTVFMEAAAMGVPVLTSNLSSIPALVKDGETGFVCAPGDLDCYEARIRGLAGRSLKELEPMLLAARTRLVDDFHPDAVHKRLLDSWLS